MYETWKPHIAGFYVIKSTIIFINERITPSTEKYKVPMYKSYGLLSDHHFLVKINGVIRLKQERKKNCHI